MQGIETHPLFRPLGRAARDKRRGPTPSTGNTFLDAQLRQIEPEIANSFTPEQLRALKTIFRTRGLPRQVVGLRQSFAFGRRSYFFSMHFGPVRRNRTLWHKPSAAELVAGYGLAFGAVVVALAAAYGVACLVI